MAAGWRVASRFAGIRRVARPRPPIFFALRRDRRAYEYGISHRSDRSRALEAAARM